MKLYLLKHNNYSNRKIIPLSTGDLSDAIYTIDPCNFNEGDGVNAVVVVNTASVGNYVVIYDDVNDSYSHWFVTASTFTRRKQQRLTLRRDVILDNWDDIIYRPSYISRCIVDDDDDLIFNSEGCSFNQIKKEERPIYDIIGAPWIVIYVDKGASYPLDVSIPSSTIKADVTLSGTLENWEYSKYIDSPLLAFSPIKISGVNDYFYRTYACTVKSYTDGYRFIYSIGNSVDGYSFKYEFGASSLFITNTGPFGKALNSSYTANKSDMNNLAVSWFKANVDNFMSDPDELIEQFLPLDGKLVYFQGENKYYRIAVKQNESVAKSYDITSGSLYNSMLQRVKDTGYYESGPETGKSAVFKLYTAFLSYSLTATEETAMSASTISITANHKFTTDANYDIFALPYADDMEIHHSSGAYVTNKSNQMMLAQQIIQKLTSTHCYDAQIVPYCPISYLRESSQGGVMNISITGLTSGTDYQFTKDNDGFVFFVPSCQSDFVINSLSVSTFKSLKVSNECEMYRLVSPNFASSFEFSIAKNGGSVKTWNVDMTLKPMNPHIHVSPSFERLYGYDAKDARGLILNGDFSIPMVSSSWLEYEAQNKNYELIFNRRIENMDVTYGIQRQEAGFGIVSGAISATASGMASGALAGGAVGSTVGGMVSGIASGVGGILDYSNLRRTQEENKAYTTDLYRYQLGNVKALGYTISKIGCLNADFKFFPILERYSCSDSELKGFEDMIKYRSMTYGKIDKIINHLHSDYEFIQATPIHLPDDMDSHMADEIRNELSQGLLMKGE